MNIKEIIETEYNGLEVYVDGDQRTNEMINLINKNDIVYNEKTYASYKVLSIAYDQDSNHTIFFMEKNESMKESTPASSSM
jgi:hypothetical protein